MLVWIDSSSSRRKVAGGNGMGVLLFGDDGRMGTVVSVSVFDRNGCV